LPAGDYRRACAPRSSGCEGSIDILNLLGMHDLDLETLRLGRLRWWERL
jgi:hypothetical protein